MRPRAIAIIFAPLLLALCSQVAAGARFGTTKLGKRMAVREWLGTASDRDTVELLSYPGHGRIVRTSFTIGRNKAKTRDALRRGELSEPEIAETTMLLEEDQQSADGRQVFLYGPAGNPRAVNTPRAGGTIHSTVWTGKRGKPGQRVKANYDPRTGVLRIWPAGNHAAKQREQIRSGLSPGIDLAAAIFNSAYANFWLGMAQ
jgi:hypothetical protein